MGLEMGVMSSFEKFFVNRSNEGEARRLLGMIEEGVAMSGERRDILELGAGKGALSYSLYKKLNPARLVVTDYDPSQVALAESYFRAKLGGIPENAEMRTADALALPFANASFDLVLASHVLHHVEKREWHFKNIPKALEEIHRVLKEGGYFILEEIFNKRKIEESLTSLGFTKLFERRPWPGDRFYIFRKNAATLKVVS